MSTSADVVITIIGFPKDVEKCYFGKDLTIALEEAEAMKLSLPGLALVKQLYVSIQAMGKGSCGNQALYLALEKLANMIAVNEKVSLETSLRLKK